jgi:hypothetical protein
LPDICPVLLYSYGTCMLAGLCFGCQGLDIFSYFSLSPLFFPRLTDCIAYSGFTKLILILS